MKSAKRKYTFQDWKDGRIPKTDFSNKEINELPDDMRSTVSIWKVSGSDWPVLWGLFGLIDRETRQQIEKEKKRAFLIGAESSAESKFRRFKEFIKTVADGNRESVLELEIQKSENWFEGEALKQRVLAGHVNERSISPELYSLFISNEKQLNKDSKYTARTIPQIRHETEDGFKFVDFEDTLFYAHANYRYQEKLKSYQSDIFPNEKQPWERVEEIKESRDITYDDAIDIFNGQVGYKHFKNYASFNSSRYKAKRGY